MIINEGGKHEEKTGMVQIAMGISISTAVFSFCLLLDMICLLTSLY